MEFKDINLEGYKWPRFGITDETLRQCKDNVKNFAYQHYYVEKGIGDYMEAILDDTYMLYNSTFDWSEEKKLSDYKHILNVIKHYGFGQAEYAAIGQGWWYFVNWIIKAFTNK